VVLSDPKGCKFDSKTDGGDDTCICHVTIKGKLGETRQHLFKDMKSRVISANAIMGQKAWGQQFKDALFAVGDDEEDDEEESSTPSAFDYFMHIIAIPWKLLFAFVPPPDYCGGWACFTGALVMIAVVTAIVGDAANLVGCCFDILPETAAITFVALGTSLPDTFASKTAAMMDPYADASIGNITGSNSINVFMGIGIAWTLAAFRWETGEPDEIFFKKLTHMTPAQRENVADVMANKNGHAVFVTPAGTIWFNLMVFSVNAFFALQHLYARRKRFGGELGGPKKGIMGQYFSGAFLVAQWFIYVIASIIFARTGDSALSYGQIAEQARMDELPYNASAILH
jgi:solute carrier family 8 (sodium/calcium exchanger)